MFQSGGSELFLHTKKLIEVAAEIIKALPQNISISGHTDATKFGNGGEYSNWELSADRANAARRWLEVIGVKEDRIDRVVGRAATEPLVLDNPNHPSNRRLSIILLRGTGKDNPVTQAGSGKPKKEEPEALPGLNKIRSEPAAPPKPANENANPGLPSLGIEIDPSLSNSN